MPLSVGLFIEMNLNCSSRSNLVVFCFCIRLNYGLVFKQFGSIQNRVLHILVLQFNKSKMPDVSGLKRQLHVLKLVTGSEIKMVDEDPVRMFLSKNGIDKKGTKYQVRRECLERFKIRV